MREQGSAPAHLGLGHTLIIAILLFAGAGTVGNLNVFLLLLGLACAEPAAQASRIRATSAGKLDHATTAVAHELLLAFFWLILTCRNRNRSTPGS